MKKNVYKSIILIAVTVAVVSFGSSLFSIWASQIFGGEISLVLSIIIIVCASILITKVIEKIIENYM